ncbi:conserved Plasmodium protein, unknown function [Plasmodium berghei]|uniref:FMR1-interacting protein 1 conserved domain-containing protein n=2 Tax=Plasmodium berghei TaxID=5821 RepID=A0A509AQA7_PLABA|nr:conserved Plasmodium protein, unknown function [Plasmodium berghei ANKA]CXI97849.1 conserved Plasmodium protein, unknown function [Plasmodium berghei]SCL97603.1 conserved Plasmodium protein, unknown function [Plasmodium berghei]SCM16644.1 conserved Plasmodium protein, unknown function [Plasmodium berghei]SCM18441.1 conserved Plasmodium protein, unknown function [Plasmodium berghei]SCN27872.1 conserved Plasmodium protein, unknown function [Plasmodium berghei]|eukprot:XP_034423526.1 conserved Plasmodium protein, unknown function [Plasmodium berghei ANKA]
MNDDEIVNKHRSFFNNKSYNPNEKKNNVNHGKINGEKFNYANKITKGESFEGKKMSEYNYNCQRNKTIINSKYRDNQINGMENGGQKLYNNNYLENYFTCYNNNDISKGSINNNAESENQHVFSNKNNMNIKKRLAIYPSYKNNAYFNNKTGYVNKNALPNVQSVSLNNNSNNNNNNHAYMQHNLKMNVNFNSGPIHPDYLMRKEPVNWNGNNMVNDHDANKNKNRKIGGNNYDSFRETNSNIHNNFYDNNLQQNNKIYIPNQPNSISTYKNNLINDKANYKLNVNNSLNIGNINNSYFMNGNNYNNNNSCGYTNSHNKNGHYTNTINYMGNKKKNQRVHTQKKNNNFLNNHTSIKKDIKNGDNNLESKKSANKNESKNIYCKYCNIEVNEKELEEHNKLEHIKCPIDNCGEIYNIDFFDIHLLSHEKNEKNENILESKEEIQKWIEERKKNYPTKKKIMDIKNNNNINSETKEKKNKEKKITSLIEKLLVEKYSSAIGRNIYYQTQSQRKSIFVPILNKLIENNHKNVYENTYYSISDKYNKKNIKFNKRVKKHNLIDSLNVHKNAPLIYQLMKNDIYVYEQKLMQCIEFIVNNNFFDNIFDANQDIVEL